MFERSPAKQILTAADWPYPANAIFNPGAVRLADGTTLLLCRVETKDGLSHLTAARSTDGINEWEIDPAPTLRADPNSPYERWGVEDCRITPIDGGERFTLYVKDLATGETTQIAEGLKWSLTWAADSRTLFATRADHAQRPHQIWRFDADGERDPELVLEEPDERFFVGVDRTRDRAYVLLEIGSKLASEVHLVDGQLATATQAA